MCNGPSTGGNMLTHEALPTPPPDPRPTDPPEAGGGGGTRNGLPLYDFAAKRIVHHLVLQPPVRTSALRGLGALPNVFALECFMDELAERAGVDPVQYRLSLLSDPRARRLIENVAERCDWASRGAAGSGRGIGLGWARYKNKAAYAAVAVEVEVDQEVRVRRAWCAADAGLVINPDGARNQLEGGIVQAISMTLKEQVRLDGDGTDVAGLEDVSDPALLRSAGDQHGDRARAGSADAGHGRVHVRADGGGDRQCGGACARRAHPRHAADARTHRGGVAGVVCHHCFVAALLAMTDGRALTPHGSDHRGATLGDADHDVVQQVGDAIAAPRLA